MQLFSTPESRDDREDSESRIASLVASLVKAVLVGKRPKGLIVVGGNTANAVLHQIGAEGLRILGRLSPVVPVLGIVGGPFDGLPIVTKGGGVGGEDIPDRRCCSSTRHFNPTLYPRIDPPSGNSVIYRRNQLVNNASQDNRPILGLTIGDPSGVGPEITVKAAMDPALQKGRAGCW